MPATPMLCCICNKPVTYQGRGRPPKTCGPVCHAKRRAQVQDWEPNVEKNCLECNRPFLAGPEGERPRHADYCTPECYLIRNRNRGNTSNPKFRTCQAPFCENSVPSAISDFCSIECLKKVWPASALRKPYKAAPKCRCGEPRLPDLNTMSNPPLYCSDVCRHAAWCERYKVDPASVAVRASTDTKRGYRPANLKDTIPEDYEFMEWIYTYWCYITIPPPVRPLATCEAIHAHHALGFSKRRYPTRFTCAKDTATHPLSIHFVNVYSALLSTISTHLIYNPATKDLNKAMLYLTTAQTQLAAYWQWFGEAVTVVAPDSTWKRLERRYGECLDAIAQFKNSKNLDARWQGLLQLRSEAESPKKQGRSDPSRATDRRRAKAEQASAGQTGQASPSTSRRKGRGADSG